MRTRLLEALSLFGDAHLQSMALDYVLSEHITASDIRYVMQGEIYTEERAARTRGRAYRHYDALTRKMAPFAVPFMPQFLGGGCDPELLKAAYDCFVPRIGDTPREDRRKRAPVWRSARA